MTGHDMWTETTREKYRRDQWRYASDTRAGEWAQIAPLLPARLGRGRRLAKDFEATIASATAWVLLANLRLLSRRLARP